MSESMKEIANRINFYSYLKKELDNYLAEIRKSSKDSAFITDSHIESVKEKRKNIVERLNRYIAKYNEGG